MERNLQKKKKKRQWRQQMRVIQKKKKSGRKNKKKCLLQCGGGPQKKRIFFFPSFFHLMYDGAWVQAQADWWENSLADVDTCHQIDISCHSGRTRLRDVRVPSFVAGVVCYIRRTGRIVLLERERVRVTCGDKEEGKKMTNSPAPDWPKVTQCQHKSWELELREGRGEEEEEDDNNSSAGDGERDRVEWWSDFLCVVDDNSEECPRESRFLFGKETWSRFDLRSECLLREGERLVFRREELLLRSRR